MLAKIALVSSPWLLGANNDNQHMHERAQNNKQSKLNDN